MTALVVPLVMLGLAGAAENAVLVQLIERGVPAGADDFVKLAPPVMANKLDAAAQQEVIKRVAGSRRLDDLMRDAIVAPFIVEITDLPTRDEAHPFRRGDVFFIAHGALEKFGSEKFLEELADLATAEKKGELPVAKGILTAEELRARRLTQEDNANVKERYCYSTFTLLERVYVSATRRVIVTKTPDSVLVASIIDRQFNNDRLHPNQWQSISRSESGKVTLGPPHPYDAAGFYVKVTRLADRKDTLFIEYHHVFEEPPAWFNRTGLLRSKIPMVAQDAIRKLRRKLREPLPEKDQPRSGESQ